MTIKILVGEHDGDTDGRCVLYEDGSCRAVPWIFESESDAEEFLERHGADLESLLLDDNDFSVQELFEKFYERKHRKDLEEKELRARLAREEAEKLSACPDEREKELLRSLRDNGRWSTTMPRFVPGLREQLRYLLEKKLVTYEPRWVEPERLTYTLDVDLTSEGEALAATLGPATHAFDEKGPV